MIDLVEQGGNGPTRRNQSASTDTAATVEGPGRTQDRELEARLIERLRTVMTNGPTGSSLGGMVRVRVRDGHVSLRAASRFGADLAERRYLPVVRDELGMPDADVEIVIDRTVANHRRRHAQEPERTAPPQAVARPARLTPPKYSFEEFVVGRTNRLAHDAAMAFALDDDPRHSASLLVLHGPCGVGKTHLLQSVAAAYAERRGANRVKSVTAETFTNEYIECVREGRIDRFRAKYRGIELLCVDDVHFLQKKDKTQQELLHTFDQLGLKGARIALASDEHPRILKHLSAPLRSRFVSGAVIGIEPPDEELCRAIVAKRATKRGMNLADAAVEALVMRAAAESRADGGVLGVRGLEGLILQVEAAARVAGVLDTGDEIGASIVEQALTQRERHQIGARRRPVRVTEIAQIVCEDLGVEMSELSGRGRHRRVVLARSIASYLARKLTTRSYPEIAMDLGRSTHTTVLAAFRRIEEQIASGQIVGVGCDFDGITVDALVKRFEQRIRVRP